MKKELEEAAEEFYSEQSKAYEDKIEPMFDTSRYLVAGFIEGANYQAKRMYSEDEQLNLLNKYNEYLFTFIDKDVVGIGVEKEDVIKWFEQFKKK